MEDLFGFKTPPNKEKLNLNLKKALFKIEVSKDEYKIYFPDDTDFKGLFFKVPTSSITKEDDTTIVISLEEYTSIYIFNPEKEIFYSWFWSELWTRVRIYMRERKKEDEKENQ